MRIVFLLLSLMFFVVLASSFFLDRSLPSSPSLSGSKSATDVATSASSGAAPEETPEEERVVEEKKEVAAPAARQAPPPPPPPPKPEPKPEPEPQPASASFTAEIEAEVLRLSNLERTKIGLNNLTLDTTLAATADAHSADMLARDFFSHDNPDGCSSSCRATSAGYKWQMIGENIFMLDGWDLTAEEVAIMVVNGWMSSPGHKENLLKPGYTESGIGVVAEDDAIYITGMYGNPR